MLILLADDVYMAIGPCTKEPVLRYVGEKNVAMSTCSMAAGKNQDTTTRFVNLKGWRKIAEQMVSLQKGDSIMAIGQMEYNEYNGKTYENLVCEWIGASISNSLSATRNKVAVTEQMRDSITLDNDLPF